MELIDAIFSSIERHPCDSEAYQDCASAISAVHQTDKDTACEYALKLRPLITANLTEVDVEKAHDLYKQTLYLAAYSDLDSYMQFMEFDLPYEKRFYSPRRKILNKILIPHLMALENKEISFLSISMPPRSGKSRSCKTFMSWHMGRNPRSTNAMCGYSGTLAKGFFDDVLELITSPDYRFSQVFPDAPFKHKSAEDFKINLCSRKTYANMTCRGIDGSWTGDIDINGILYCDDLVRDEEEAASMERMQKLYDAYANHVQDRRGDGSQELMVGTRWNVYDPMGRVMSAHEDDPKYRFVVIPALDESDESNFKYDLHGFSTEYYSNMRDLIGEYYFQTKYQGQPYVREGLLYRPEELRRFYELPSTPPDGVISVCDTKDKGADYFFSPVAYIYGDDYFIVDCICDDSLPEIVKPRLVNKYIKHNVQRCRFESNSAGGEIARSVSEMIKAENGITSISTAFTSQNKETKIIVNSDWVKDHCLFYDKESYPNEDYRKMMNFLTTYSVSGKNKHDDVPDGMAMLSLFSRMAVSNKYEIGRRIF